MKYANFIASFKLILKKGGKVLILTESYGGCVDLPGGRMEKGEEKLSMKDLFKREIREELGGGVKYKISGPALQYRRFNPYYKTFVLATAYEAEYLSGKIKLSPEHSKFEWVDPKKFDFAARKFNNPEEREAYKNYFSKSRF